jgi:hypothetical protein
MGRGRSELVPANGGGSRYGKRVRKCSERAMRM